MYGGYAQLVQYKLDLWSKYGFDLKRLPLLQLNSPVSRAIYNTVI